MCFTTVDVDFQRPPEEKEMVGYKVFLKEKDGSLSSLCQSWMLPLRMGEQKVASVGIAHDEDVIDCYILGFHFFPSREAARQYKRDVKTWKRFTDISGKGPDGEAKGRPMVIVKCRFRGLLSKGTQALPASWEPSERTTSLTAYTAEFMTPLSIVR